MENVDLNMVILACILLAGVALNRFSKFLKMPILICFLGVGILCGNHWLNLLPSFNIQRVQFFGELALAFIIFAGGLETSFSSIKKVFVTGTILSTLGVVLTALIFGVFIFLLCKTSLYPDVSFTEALMIGAVFSSTDAAAVFAILRGQKASINPNLQSLLEYESGSNDPAAFLLTTIMLGIMTSGQTLPVWGISWNIAYGIVWGLGMGALAGFLIALFGQWFYNWIQSFLEYNGLRFVVAIAIVLLCYSCAKQVFQANSLMACYVAGITMGNLRFNFKQSFIHFHDGVSWLMQIILFTVLGSFFDCHMIFSGKIMFTALICTAMLMFIARPLAVMLCMIKSPFTLRERLFTCWVGIRGSSPIMLAALVLAAVHQMGENVVYAQNLFYTVFIVVLLSIIVQGSSLLWAAKKLGIILPYEEREEALLKYDERADGREMYQFTITESCPLQGQRLGNYETENNPILLMIKRGDNFIQPSSDVILRKGDALSFLGERDAMIRLHRQYFPEEPYVSPPTFHQLWDKMRTKYAKAKGSSGKRKKKR